MSPLFLFSLLNLWNFAKTKTKNYGVVVSLIVLSLMLAVLNKVELIISIVVKNKKICFTITHYL